MIKSHVLLTIVKNSKYVVYCDGRERAGKKRKYVHLRNRPPEQYAKFSTQLLDCWNLTWPTLLFRTSLPTAHYTAAVLTIFQDLASFCLVSVQFVQYFSHGIQI